MIQIGESDPGLLYDCRAALGYTKKGLANYLAYDERILRRCEKGDQPVPILLWWTLFYMLRDAGKREMMNRVNRLIQDRRPG